MIAAFILAAGIGSAVQAAGSGCLVSQDERIQAGDLVSVLPAFSAIPADTPLRYGPLAGSRLVIPAAELKQFATRYGVALEAVEDVCFEQPVAPLTAALLTAAMRRVPGLEKAQIEVLEFSRAPAPAGEIQFSLADLGSLSLSGKGPSAVWKGRVLYAGKRQVTVWARVRITAPVTRVVAAESLRTGRPVEARQVRLEHYEGFPLRRTQAESLDQVVGRAPRRPISAGLTVALDVLEDAPEVTRGQMVSVEVRSGSVRLAFVGRAESAGHRGDSIPVLNIQSGRKFSARISGKGTAIVDATPTLIAANSLEKAKK